MVGTPGKSGPHWMELQIRRGPALLMENAVAQSNLEPLEDSFRYPRNWPRGHDKTYSKPKTCILDTDLKLIAVVHQRQLDPATSQKWTRCLVNLPQKTHLISRGGPRLWESRPSEALTVELAPQNPMGRPKGAVRRRDRRKKEKCTVWQDAVVQKWRGLRR